MPSYPVSSTPTLAMKVQRAPLKEVNVFKVPQGIPDYRFRIVPSKKLFKFSGQQEAHRELAKNFVVAPQFKIPQGTPRILRKRKGNQRNLEVISNTVPEVFGTRKPVQSMKMCQQARNELLAKALKNATNGKGFQGVIA